VVLSPPYPREGILDVLERGSITLVNIVVERERMSEVRGVKPTFHILPPGCPSST